MPNNNITFGGAGIGVADLDRAISWYQDTLALTVLRRFAITELELEICILGRGSSMLELMALSGANPIEPSDNPPRHAQPGRIAHIAFHAASLDECAARIAKAGVTELWRSPPGSDVKFLFTADPDGNYVQIIQNDTP